MRYRLWKPHVPVDPRDLNVADLTELEQLMPCVASADTEESAAQMARNFFPDLVAMPMVIKIGSSDQVWLGCIASHKDRPDAAKKIPMVLYVQPVYEHRGEVRGAVKHNGSPWTMKFWHVPPVKPTSADTHVVDAELRTTEIEVPLKASVMLGRRDGRLVIFASVPQIGVDLSIEVQDPEIHVLKVPDMPMVHGDVSVRVVPDGEPGAA